LKYPITIVPTDENKEGDCIVRAGRMTQPRDCKKTEGAREFIIKNAIPKNYDRIVTILINFKNPINNWGDIGFKIKTAEVDGENEYLVDQLEGN